MPLTQATRINMVEPLPGVSGLSSKTHLLKLLPLQTRATRINMVDLPLGATEDRVCGTIDIEKALTEGVKAFEPGLLVGPFVWH